MRILVVEDEKDLNSIICSKLVKEGYNDSACEWHRSVENYQSR